MRESTVAVRGRAVRAQAGRPQDSGRTREILRSAVELLAEVGYDRLTMDAVAERAGAGKATLYRRWPSKSRLVVDAVADFTPFPEGDDVDSGSLADDLRHALGLYMGGDPLRQRVVSGLSSALARHPELAAAMRDGDGHRHRCAVRIAFERARRRGELSRSAPLDALHDIVAAMVFYRVVFLGAPVDSAFADRLIEDVLLPVAGRTSPSTRRRRPEASGRKKRKRKHDAKP
ncbi:MAG TPA: TetR/AcrR family transcriptional regulator [Thermoanaerobaculia bacterium]|nr:TetR/AcrR family transcriptional regulator [Thermoanaerobaculia bacterium]